MISSNPYLSHGQIFTLMEVGKPIKGAWLLFPRSGKIKMQLGSFVTVEFLLFPAYLLTAVIWYRLADITRTFLCVYVFPVVTNTNVVEKFRQGFGKVGKGNLFIYLSILPQNSDPISLDLVCGPLWLLFWGKVGRPTEKKGDAQSYNTYMSKSW